jgi:hypothetical protein
LHQFSGCPDELFFARALIFVAWSSCEGGEKSPISRPKKESSERVWKRRLAARSMSSGQIVHVIWFENVLKKK